MGLALPFAVFDPHQSRLTYATITGIKLPSAMLIHIKAEQDKASTVPEVKLTGAGSGYRKIGHRNTGWNSFAARRKQESRKVIQGCDI